MNSLSTQGLEISTTTKHKCNYHTLGFIHENSEKDNIFKVMEAKEKEVSWRLMFIYLFMLADHH